MNWCVARNARFGKHATPRGRGIARKTSDAPSSAKCGGADFKSSKKLSGHGIGRTIHEPPSVPNYADFSAVHKLTEGLVLTIEPMIAAGTGHVSLGEDSWTDRTVDGSLSADYEHTIVITRGQPILLTAA